MKRRSDASPGRRPGGRRLRVGLLGGSFNPAHAGHLHISRAALDRLQLDEVWWLVSPQNPLKSASEMAPLETRLEHARAVATDPRIRVSAEESDLGTRYTVDTIRALKRRHPGVRFVWLMGADNLAEIHRWKEWREIFRSVPIAVFPRPSYSLRGLNGRAAKRFARARLPDVRAGTLAETRPPAWIFVRTRLRPESATRIRALAAVQGKSQGNKETV